MTASKSWPQSKWVGKMKNNRALAKKYAAALLALAKETGTLEEVEQELAQIGEIVQQNPELTGFLRNQLISREAKKEVVERIFTQHLNPMVMRFLGVVIDRGRIALLPDIIDVYLELSHVERNIAEAQVRLAVDLTDEEETRLIRELTELTGKEIYLEKTIDPSILGGMIVTIGDRRIDGSLKRQLHEMKTTLLSEKHGIEVTNAI
ncbi:MAG: F0F1 ATP synthase subunit delta [Negativicoccus succinicivorans]|nr:F0F1 ATP synthase subunit delta [Negativicoccus succinicivorans]